MCFFIRQGSCCIIFLFWFNKMHPVLYCPSTSHTKSFDVYKSHITTLLFVFHKNILQYLDCVLLDT